MIPVIRSWASKLALHVISRSFLKSKTHWNDYGSTVAIPFGHHLTFDNAPCTILSRLATVFVTSRILLGKLPGKMFKEAHEGFIEVTKHFHELRTSALQNMEALLKKRNKIILGEYHLTSNTELDKLIHHRGNGYLRGRPSYNGQETFTRGERPRQHLLHNTRWTRDFWQV